MVPAFPRSMIRERREGWVIVAFDVEPDGATRNVHVVSSDPGGAYDVQAVRAVSAARFPAKSAYAGCRIVFEFHLPG